MGSMPPNAGPPPGGDFSQVNQGSQGQQPGSFQQPLPPEAKKGKTWIWILGGCFGLILIGAIGAAVAGYFVVQKTKEVAGDFEKRPVFTAAKAIAMLNPEIELVDADEESERITIREVKTGKTISVTLDELTQGKLKFTDDKGEEYTLQAEGSGAQGGIRVQSSDGTEVFNAQTSAEQRFPDWVPMPAGNRKQTSKTTTSGMTIYGTVIETDTDAEAMADWLEEGAKANGLQVLSKTVTSGSGGTSLIFSAASSDKKRTFSAMGGRKAGGTMELMMTAQEKP